MKLAERLAVALTCVALSATPADIRVIVNPQVAVSSVSAEDLKSIFLGTKTSVADGSHVEPVLLRSGAAHEMFVKQYVGKTAATLVSYYRSLVFTGKGTMPPMLASDAEVVKYVAKTRGAIGYVGAEANIDAVKLLEVK